MASGVTPQGALAGELSIPAHPRLACPSRGSLALREGCLSQILPEGTPLQAKLTSEATAGGHRSRARTQRGAQALAALATEGDRGSWHIHCVPGTSPVRPPPPTRPWAFCCFSKCLEASGFC